MKTIQQFDNEVVKDLVDLAAETDHLLLQNEIEATLMATMELGAAVGLSKRDLEELVAAGIDIDLTCASNGETFSNYQAACESISHNQKVGLIATAVAGLVALLAWIAKKVWDYFKGKKEDRKAAEKTDVKVDEITICTYKALEDEDTFEDKLEEVETFLEFITENLNSDKIASVIKGKNRDEAVAAISKEFGDIFKDYAANVLKELNISPKDSATFRENVGTILEAARGYKLPFDTEVDIDIEAHYEVPKGLKDEMDKTTKHLEKLAASKEGLIKGFFMKDAEKFVSAEIVTPCCRFATFMIRSTFIPLVQEAARMNQLLDRTDGLLAKFAAPAILDGNRNSKNEAVASAFNRVDHNSLDSILKAYGAIKDADIGGMMPASHGAYTSYMAILKQSAERAEKK